MGIGDVVSGVEKAYQVAQKLHDVTLNEVIADLRLKAAELKADMADLRAENAELRESVNALRRVANIRDKMEFRQNFYHAREPIPGYGTGPFCSACLDGEGVLVNAHISPGGVRCPRCRKK